jgi:ribonucleoside-diphosphate reductase alpha chain
VLTGQGPRQVRDLVGRPCELVVDGRLWPSTDQGFFSTGVKKTFTLKTVEGNSLCLTEDHLVRKVLHKNRWRLESGWVSAGQLVPGDEIMLHNHRSLIGWPGRGTEEEGYLLGLLLGDGTLKPEAAVLSVWSCEVVNGGSHAGPQAVMGEAERCCAAALAHRSDFSGFHPVAGRNELRLQSAPLRNLAATMGMVPGCKSITPEIESSSSVFYQGFLRGLFDTDGSVQGNCRKGVSVRLAQSCKTTLEAVQRMLLRLGIASSHIHGGLPGARYCRTVRAEARNTRLKHSLN